MQGILLSHHKVKKKSTGTQLCMPLVHCLVGVGITITLKMYLELRIALLKMAA
jgi:hypothetical protein